MAPRKAIKKMKIAPPSGIKHKAPAKRVMKRKGGMIPAPLIPILAAAGVPIASALGNEAVRGAKYGVKKIRKMLGVGVLRSGATRAQGGLSRRIVVRV